LGISDFDQGFYSISVIESDVQPLDQLNYAHKTVEYGEVNCKNIEHELSIVGRFHEYKVSL
jgi:hypothetical protein